MGYDEIQGIMIVIVIITSIWVLIDAGKVGFKSGKLGGSFDYGPGGWFIFCLLFWIIGFPAYLYKRSQYEAMNSGRNSGAEYKNNSNNKSDINDDSIAQLEKLGELKAKGILTEDEFNAKKKELLR